jgi:hypothetical protein
MRDGKEDSVGFVKTIKEKVHDWWVSYDRKLWTARIFVYGFLLLLVIFIGAILFTKFNLFHTDANSARYMLSALVQSQAAIVAIVITLTLIAVQLTPSAYSPRVVDIFKKNPDMWILLGCYGVSIFYGFIVLKLVEGSEGEFVSQSVIWYLPISFESYVSMAYWLGAFTFVALIPYMWNIIGLLKPENIINRLATEITKGKILNPKEDPVQPIVDIIHGSIKNYDLETTRVGLKAVTDRVIEIINSDREEEISGHFCKHLERVGKLAISKLDEESAREVIKNLGIFEKLTAEKELEKATTQVVVLLEGVGKSAAEKELEDATWEAVKFLGEVGGAAAKQGLKDATSRAVSSLENVGKSAAEKRLEGATKLAALCLGNVGEAAAKKCLEDATWRVAESLEIVGKTAAKQGLKDATSRAASSLVDVGITSVKNSLEDATHQAAKSLAELTISNEEIVKTAIREHESKLEEQDLDSFHKFREIYSEELGELEKLQAET